MTLRQATQLGNLTLARPFERRMHSAGDVRLERGGNGGRHLVEWHRWHPSQRRFLTGAMVLASALVASAAGLRAWLDAQILHIDAVRRAASTGVESAQRSAVTAVVVTDFTSALPVSIPAEVAVRDAAMSAAKLGIQLSNLSVQPGAANPRTLPRTVLSAELRGRYLDVKLWLRELLARYPSLALVTLDLRRPADPAGGEVTASVQLRLYGRPGPASAGEGPR